MPNLGDDAQITLPKFGNPADQSRSLLGRLYKWGRQILEGIVKPDITRLFRSFFVQLAPAEGLEKIGSGLFLPRYKGETTLSYRNRLKYASVSFSQMSARDQVFSVINSVLNIDSCEQPYIYDLIELPTDGFTVGSAILGKLGTPAANVLVPRNSRTGEELWSSILIFYRFVSPESIEAILEFISSLSMLSFRLKSVYLHGFDRQSVVNGLHLALRGSYLVLSRGSFHTSSGEHLESLSELTSPIPLDLPPGGRCAVMLEIRQDGQFKIAVEPDRVHALQSRSLFLGNILSTKNGFEVNENYRKLSANQLG